MPGSAPVLTGPWQQSPRLILDVVGLSLLWSVELLVTWERTQDTGWEDAAVVVLLSIVLYLPLLLRRRHPLVVMLVVVLGSTFPSVLVPGFHPVFCVWVALFGVAVHSSRLPSVLGLVLAFVPVGPNVAETLRDTPDPTRHAAAAALVTVVLSLVNAVVYGLGRWMRWSVAQRALTARLSAARAESEERRRIGRELHDSVAHAVSLMILQAGVAERLLARDPDRARAVLRQLGELGEQATAELRRMLGLLAEAPTEEASGAMPVLLHRLQPLLDQVRSAGRDVRLTVTGPAHPLAPAAGECALRVLQESLTNAVKHADPRQPIDVGVSWAPEQVILTVRTFSRPFEEYHPDASPGGHGIPNMRHRAQAVGGTVTAGPTAEGGFLVRASVPVPPAGGEAPSRQHPAAEGGG